MRYNNQKSTKLLRISELLYLFLVTLAFYLLFLSRTGEAHTVWEVLHPAFIPVFFVGTSLLITIILTSEKATYKLLLIIVHSVLAHSFFSIIFPGGDLSGQQMVFGKIRLVYDNAILHGWPPWPVEPIQSQVFQFFRGENFQAALSVVFARMFSIDILWTHLLFIPVLWGVFTPVAVYLTANVLTKNDKVSILASVLFSAFPYATYFGAISVPNSLGFIILFFSLFFMLKYLSSDDSKTTFLMVAFTFAAFLAHYLTGIISLSLLLLTIGFKANRNSKPSSATAKLSMASSFIVSASVLPLSLVYLRFFRPGTGTLFTFDKFYDKPLEEIVGLFLFGELTYGFDIQTILLVALGPTLAFASMAYQMYRSRKTPTGRVQTPLYFLFSAFLMMMIDYRILKLFMEGLPLNEERLWVFRDFIAAPFVALTICAVISSLKSFLEAKSPRKAAGLSVKSLSKGNVLRVVSIFLVFNVFVSIFLGGWTTLSLSAAYPEVAPLQTTWYELEAVKYIEDNTKEKYVVIGDIWTIFAGERIVGIMNPRAYYFAEYNNTGYSLFVSMRREPSPQWMLLAMNLTNTAVAYFIVTEPRLGIEEFATVVSNALQNGQLTVAGVFGAGKLYVFAYGKEQNL